MPRTRAREAKNVIAALHAAHWAILPESLKQMMEIAARSIEVPINTIEALEAKLGKPVNADELMTVRDRVATIPVSGPLFRYANLFTLISGATAYATLATDLQQALDDPNVNAIILAIDSPGGEVNGNAELSQMIYDARGKKPIVAYISHLGASAAYWLASAADEIVVSPTSIVGAIGAVLSISDRSAQDAARGVRTIEIVSSQSPKKRLAPTSTEGQAELQILVDNMATVFIETVARNRGVTVDVVAADFGQGGVFVGETAVAPGLVDRLGSYEQIHAELASGTYARPTRAAARRSTTTSQESDMRVQVSAAALAAATAAAINPALATGVAAAEGDVCECGHPQSNHADGSGACSAETEPGKACSCVKYAAKPAEASAPNPAAAATEPAQPEAPAAVPDATGADAPSPEALAATAERERILAIEALGRPGEETIIAECKRDPNCTPAMAALRLRQADGVVRSNRLTSLQKDDTQLEAPGPVSPEATDQTSAGAVARRIIAVHEQVTSPNKR